MIKNIPLSEKKNGIFYLSILSIERSRISIIRDYSAAASSAGFSGISMPSSVAR